MPKKIAIISTANRGGGSETFLRGLMPQLLNISDEVEYHLFLADSIKDNFLFLSDRLIVHPISMTIIKDNYKRFFFENLTLFHLLQKIKPDLCFYTSEIINPLLSFLKIPVITMYHATLQFYMLPGIDESRLKLTYVRFMRDISVFLADRVVAVSHYEKAELGGRYPQFMFSKFVVIYHGVDKANFNNIFFSSLDTPLGFEFPYILCVGDRYRHKKIDYMLKIYKRMRDSFSIVEHFIIIGKSKSEAVDKQLFSYVESNDLQNWVHFIEHIDNNSIGFYYKRAKLYWTNSSCESFGLTPLEAMACGTPVVSTWESSLPEIYGKAVTYYDPNFTEEEDVAQTIYTCLMDEQLRIEMINRGFELVERFDWENTAKKYLNLFKMELKK